MKRENRVLHHKRCEYCDKEFTAVSSKARTCSGLCRVRLFRKGFSNPKFMELVAWFKNPKDAQDFFETLPVGTYNKTREKSGYCYIYKYTKYAIDNGYCKGNPNCKHKTAVCKKCGKCNDKAPNRDVGSAGKQPARLDGAKHIK